MQDLFPDRPATCDSIHISAQKQVTLQACSGLHQTSRVSHHHICGESVKASARIWAKLGC